MLSLHRKYRPQTVDQLDQESVRNFFNQILKTGQFAQAYLFAGPKGTGKTSGARILAKILNCDLNLNAQKSFKEPCNKCDSCLGIAKGYSNGVVELDAASNRGIDDIRSLREQIHLVPAQTAYIVYIIDEVHMLTSEAFNALLKILEEPPVHAVFCLATTEKHKLPGTIISRCVQVVYNKSTSKEIQRSLGRVVEGEKIQIDPEALDLISQWSDGSFRDGLNLLQTIYTPGEKISLETVESKGSITSLASINNLIQTLRQFQTKEALAIITDLVNAGSDPAQINKLIVNQVLGLVHQDLDTKGSVESDLLKIIEVFSQAFKRYADVPIPSLPLEMAVVEYCLQGDPSVVSNNPSPKPSSDTQPINTSTPVSKPAPSVQPQKMASKSYVAKPKQVTTSTEPEEVETPKPDLPQNQVDLTLDLVKQKWGQVLAEVDVHNHGLMGLLSRGEIRDCQTSLISFCVGYDFHKEQLEQERYVSIIETALAKVFNGQVRLSVIVGDPKTDTKVSSQHKNISGKIQAEDQAFVSSVEEVFGV